MSEEQGPPPAADPAHAASDKPYPALRLVVILILMNVIAYLDRSILSLAAPAMREDLGLTNVQLSILMGLGFVMFFVILGVPLGWLVDRMSRRLLVFIGITFWSIAASCTGLARTFTTLLIARFSVGAGEAVLHPAAYSMLADGSPPKSFASHSAAYGGSSGLGGAVSAVAGGLLLGMATTHGPVTLPIIGTLQPWQVVLILTGLPGLFLAPIMFLVPEPKRRDRFQKADGKAPKLRDLLAYVLARWRFYGATIGGISISYMMASTFGPWIPMHMVERFHWKIEHVGLVMGVTQLLSFGGALAAGWFVDRLKRGGLRGAELIFSGATMAWCGAMFGLAFLAGDLNTFLILLVLGNLPVASVGLTIAAVQQMTPNEFRGQIIAFHILMGNLIGFGLGPLCPALLTDFVFRSDSALGLSVAIVTLITGPLAAMLLWLGVGPMRNREHGLRDAQPAAV